MNQIRRDLWRYAKPTRTGHWRAEKMIGPGAVLWMAATLEQAGNEGDDTWSEFALVARDLGRWKAPRRHTPT